MRRTWWLVLGLLAAGLTGVGGCGSDDAAPPVTPAPATTNGAGGGGAEGGATTISASGGGGAGGGTGGAGGVAFIDPLAGVAPVEEISTGHAFSEGTAWFPASQRFFFSDIPDDEIYAVSADGQVSLWTDASAGTNGNVVDVDGSMISCEQGNRRLVRRADLDVPTTVEVIVDSYQGMALNRPNDVIVRSDGQIYFTDPNYSVANQELPFQGVFHVDPQAGNAITLVDDQMNKPNGIGLSPDESILYVTDAANAVLWSFDVEANGTIAAGSKTKVADTSGSPDGFAVDDQGYLYVTTAAGVEVHAPDGSLFGTIAVPMQPSNCAFGGADRRTLLITARSAVYQVVLNVPGLP